MHRAFRLRFARSAGANGLTDSGAGRRIPFIFTVLFLCASGCVGRASTQELSKEPPYRVDPSAPERLVVRADLAARLKTAIAEGANVNARVVGYGRVGFASDAAYAVRAPFPSYVERVLVLPGDQVKVGQALAELRSSDLARLRAELSRAQVQVRVQSQTVERLRPLVADGTGTQRELAEAEAGLQVAEAELASVRHSLRAAGPTAGAGDRYTLRASADGYVVRRNIAAGERVNPEEEPAFLIGDPDRLVVRASFPDRDARWLREGASCFFTVDALSGERLEGNLSRVLRSVNPSTRSVEALCAPKEQRGALVAEMAVRVEAEVGGEGSLWLPRSALLMKRDQWIVFVQKGENVLERRDVRPGVALGDRVQILGGVASDESVVVEGAVLLDGELDVLL